MIAAAMALASAIVIADSASLRASPRDSAQQQAQLWQGEMVEVRGERLDYVQVYDHHRERAGFVKASQLRRTSGDAQEAPELLALVRFVRDTPGSEALGLGLVAAWIQAAPAPVLRGDAGIEAFDALGTMADRLAHRASFGANLGKAAQATLAAHLEVATRYGIGFRSYEREGRMQVCYDGDAFRRVLAAPEAKPAQQARAALALTRPECIDPNLKPLEHRAVEAWRADVLDKVEVASLPGYLKNRVQLRRASVWSTLAFEDARAGKPADVSAQRALAALGAVTKAELTDVDQPAYAEAAMRTNASRWAAVPAPALDALDDKRPSIVTAPGDPGQTCVLLVDAKHDATKPLAKRCTYALVWTASQSMNREGNALALAVQPLAGWRELWVFHRQAHAWMLDVLPPATTAPDVGYAEFAGWVPGGKQMLVAREAQGEGKYRRSFELVAIDTLATQRQSTEANALGPFQRWQDVAWRKSSVALR